MQTNFIAPSILAADFARLGEEVDNALAAGADMVHFDVMDNHYVPNLTIGPLVCDALRQHGVTAPIDVHLMIEPVDRIIPDFVAAGASYITFHPEASQHVDRTLQLIRNEGCKAGLVLNPATPLGYLDHVMDKLDSARVEQEIVIVATKLDVSEEMDRLDTHVEEVRHILKQRQPVGRRLDFLMQELNREANTLGSKSTDASTTRASVDLKVLIEQIREQIQNVE